MQDPRLQQTQVYTEFGGLNALKTQARTDREGALAEVARQFEGLFVSEMLKSMRKAGEVFGEGNMLNSEQSKFYRDMFDNQLSLTLSGNQGLGLSETLVRQLSQQVPGLDANGDRLASHRQSIADYDRSMPAISRELPERLQEVNQVAEEVSSSSVVSRDQPLPTTFESPGQFVEHLLPLAERVAADSGVNPRLMVAQAALETGWGRHMIEGSDGAASFNLFGIKADQRWDGESVNIATSEYREGVKMSERAEFRAYPDFESSFRDYVSFLESNPRYEQVLASADDPDLFAQRLQEAGYATDPEYADKIRRIMNSDQLTNQMDSATQLSLGPKR